jgi:gliding motility-associated-like protein
MKIPCSLLRSGENGRQYFIGTFFISLIFSGTISGQPTTSTHNSKPVSTTAKVNFSVKPFTPYFVENKGQFDQYDANNKAADFKSPSYGSQLGNAIVLFNGTSIQFVEPIIKNKEKEEKGKGEKISEERETEIQRQTLTFVGANANAEFVASNIQQLYYTYPDPKIKDGTIKASAWNGLQIKNIYPGINLYLTFQEAGGIKYTFQVNPGADASQIKMKWDGVENPSIDADGNLNMNSENGIITDHAPSSATYSSAYTGKEPYEGRTGITSKFSLSGKIISFELGEYNHQETLMIDPWVFSPNLSGNNKAYDIQHDFNGDIYCYGGSNPYQLQKYTSLGAPIWSFSTFASGYYGDFTLDATGNAYCIYGPWGDAALKLSPTGSVIWNVPTQNSQRETYRIFPNPVNGQMSVMGMEIPGSGLYPMLLNVDPATGARAPSVLHPTCSTGEIRCMSVDVNGDVFGMVFATVSSVNTLADNFIWKVDATNVSQASVVDGYNLNEVDPSNTDSQFSGFNGTAVGCNLFTYDGMTLKKWDKATVTQLASVSIPGGIPYVTGGVCTDACGNVYVGGPNSILEFDNNLVLVTSVATSGQVYDVNNGNVAGEILACGNQFFGSFTFPVSSCSSNTTITSTNSTSCACNGSATISASQGCGGGSFTYQWSPSGGTSATATNLCPGNYTCYFTNTSTGVVDSESVTITGLASGITVTANITNATCSGSNGSLTANPTGGQGPYTYSWAPNGQTTQTISGLPGGTYTVTVTDANGCVEIQSFTVTTTAGMSLSLSSIQPSCSGFNGSATANPIGGTGPYTYSWNTTPVQTTQTATGLNAGSYSVTITDANGCTADTVFSLNSNSPMTLTAALGQPVLCFGGCTGTATANPASGQAPYTYSWNTSPIQTTQTATGLCAGTYSVTVTDANGCTSTVSITLTQPSALNVAMVGDSVCPGIQTQISASGSGGTGPYTYSWSNGPTTQNQNVIIGATTNYTVTVTDANGCQTTGVTTVAANPVPIASITTNAVNGVYVVDPAQQLCFYGTNGVSNWIWNLNGTGTSNLQSPCVAITGADTGTYCASLIVQNSYGCLDTANLCIEIQNVFYSIPNVYTPNGDGNNDVFMITNEGMKSLHCLIYDRWGVLIYEWDSPTGYWDGRVFNGKEAVDGVYYWTVDMVDYSGKQYGDHGFVHLIRGGPK